MVHCSDLLPAKNGEEQTVQFLLEVVDILLNYVKKTFDRSTKVLDFHHPHQILEGMEGFNLELSDNPESLEQILVDCRDTLKYGVRTGERIPGLNTASLSCFVITVLVRLGLKAHDAEALLKLSRFETDWCLEWETI